MSTRAAVLAAAVLAVMAPRRAPGEELKAHRAVLGDAIARVDVAEGLRAGTTTVWTSLEWASLAASRIPKGPRLVRVRVPVGSRALEFPVCAGRRAAWIDGQETPVRSAGPLMIEVPADGATHEVIVAITVGEYERRIACGSPPRAGSLTETFDGLSVLTFASPRPRDGGGVAVVFLPPGHDRRAPAAMLVGAHPWNGSIWTYAAYAELLQEAATRDVVLLMPSGLGNSLYTAAAEDEVLSAIDAVAHEVAIDPRRVSLWGASMGGAGATTIGLHHPDRFATVTSFFGDSKYDLSTYVRAILHDETAAHLVNGLDVVDNARWLPVWLIHGERDRVSPLAQSDGLAQALRARGFSVRFDRVADAGHEGALVARYAAALVALASHARAKEAPPRVSYRSVRAGDTEAYGVRFERASSSGDAMVDVERRGDEVFLRAATGVSRVVFARGALGFPPTTSPPIAQERGLHVDAQWDPLPATDR